MPGSVTPTNALLLSDTQAKYHTYFRGRRHLSLVNANTRDPVRISKPHIPTSSSLFPDSPPHETSVLPLLIDSKPKSYYYANLAKSFSMKGDKFVGIDTKLARSYHGESCRSPKYHLRPSRKRTPCSSLLLFITPIKEHPERESIENGSDDYSLEIESDRIDAMTQENTFMNTHMLDHFVDCDSNKFVDSPCRVHWRTRLTSYGPMGSSGSINHTKGDIQDELTITDTIVDHHETETPMNPSAHNIFELAHPIGLIPPLVVSQLNTCPVQPSHIVHPPELLNSQKDMTRNDSALVRSLSSVKQFGGGINSLMRRISLSRDPSNKPAETNPFVSTSSAPEFGEGAPPVLVSELLIPKPPSHQISKLKSWFSTYKRLSSNELQ